MKGAINWFEIPTADFDRAATFYETILSAKMERMAMGDYRMAFFPKEAQDEVGGALTGSATGVAPSDKGTAVYINCNGRLEEVVGRVAEAGGSIVTDITALPEDWGRFAIIRDTEGNRVGLHTV